MVCRLQEDRKVPAGVCGMCILWYNNHDRTMVRCSHFIAVFISVKTEKKPWFNSGIQKVSRVGMRSSDRNEPT